MACRRRRPLPCSGFATEGAIVLKYMIISRFDYLTFLSNNGRSGHHQLSPDLSQGRSPPPYRLTWLRRPSAEPFCSAADRVEEATGNRANEVG
jgi:hypothetical protein